MILVDMNQCMISNLMMQIKVSDGLDENLVRHMVLNSIRHYKKTFSEEYGQLVLCYDSKFYWRKEKFPFYKQNRKKDREKSNHDWSKIFDVLNKIRDELREHFPYIVMEIYGAEADDIISVLSKYTAVHNSKLQKYGAPIEKVLILSGDKDFIQLSKYPCVNQYNPILKKYVRFQNPKEYLIEHIIKGDRSDGIPNFLSDDDTFVSGKRQKPISKKNLVKWITQEPESFCNSDQLKNYLRNKNLIDLSCVPIDLETKIVHEFELLNSNVIRKVNLNYFLNNKLTSLLNEIEDF
jgi:5'-3' exonuclease